MSKTYYVYILTNFTNRVLYVGVTNNLFKRVSEHKHKLVVGFSSKYHLNKLVYFEKYTSVLDALNREKQLKNWRRIWKLELIQESNKEFNDLSLDPGSSPG